MSKKQESSITSGSTTRQTDTAKTSPSTGIAGSAVALEQEQGFRGIEVDPTPNENYTVAGVTSGAPTPETDLESAKDVRSETGLGLSALEAAAREKAQRGEK